MYESSPCACACGDVLVKVCGITRQEDADAAIAINASLLGFIFHPASPRAMTPAKARAICTGERMRVGVFVNQTPGEILDIMDDARLHLAQLHGDQDEACCLALGRQRVMRAFWPERHANLADFEAELARFAPFCRFFLFDAGASGGGHGKSLDWAALGRLKSPRSWFLAGGLSPDNVRQAVDACNPDGVDLNSGVEAAPGIKDPAKLAAAREALCAPASNKTT
ncbi:phosphoribosylanthranilate isomerase [Megalodesulfovibrio gigas]|uniref:N-(5'-phosphoribosyl)anthranilate isomerase n=1 Tax=Megalodesulfovibrio gigas (strain ATCC 19364 / DSM 1382 / NCIMB 9332 / VKM B-1759) TaxID=1121448 RepID=T2G8K3_MEGG1|nr:phosphoribosylanthranilate isomerase [Megalodesulfovibrio gigas]AGW12509.1 putative Phosphoribosylanthranilate isomerase [Megalodesulfovibrio gigas DSM 1382 = ATCC 19364]